jgi:flagellar biosynthetic protein FlhB
MSDDEDKEGKTEHASERKTQDAIEKGNVPFSREAVSLAGLVAMLVAAKFLLLDSALSLGSSLAMLLDASGSYHLDNGADVVRLFGWLTGAVALALAGPLLLLPAFGVVASLAQNKGVVLSGERLKPSWNRISPFAGAKRILGLQGLIELVKSVVKIGVVSVVAFVLVRGDVMKFVGLMYADPRSVGLVLVAQASDLLLAVVGIVVVLAVADFLWTGWKWRRDLMMSRKELKDEYKQLEGNPLVKSRLRAIARQMMRKRMMSNVPRATLVVANPTHYAVALRYEKSEGGAPVVLAKGKNLLALKIREIAEQRGIPVVEDKSLARALYAKVEVDQMIPQEFYKAVAGIIIFLHNRGKLRRAIG